MKNKVYIIGLGKAGSSFSFELDQKEYQVSYLTDRKEENIKKLASVLGFKYRWNPGNKQWIHPAVAYVLTPGGKISRFFNGISFQERDLRLALVEAGGGKIGTIADQFALFCFQFDPTKNKYTLYAYNLMKLGGGITVLFVGAFLLIFWRKENRNHLDTKE